MIFVGRNEKRLPHLYILTKKKKNPVEFKIYESSKIGKPKIIIHHAPVHEIDAAVRNLYPDWPWYFNDFLYFFFVYVIITVSW